MTIIPAIAARSPRKKRSRPPATRRERKTRT
jgi:hypothetical protein